MDFSLNFTYEGMTRDLTKTEGEEETGKTTETENIGTVKEGTINEYVYFNNIIFLENEENSDLAEVRKLIQIYMKEELRKIENTTEEQEAPRLQMEKPRRIKSSSSKASKPRTPK